MPTEKELLAANIRLQLGEFDDPNQPVAALVRRLAERNKALVEALRDLAAQQGEIALAQHDRDYFKRMWDIADKCAHERESSLLAQDREIAALRKDVEALRAAASAAADYLDANFKLNTIGHGSILHNMLRDAVSTPPTKEQPKC